MPIAGEQDDVFAGIAQPGETDFERAYQHRDSTYNARPPGSTLNGNTVLTIVHTNGVHHLPVVRCGCPDKKTTEVQDFLQVGLVPASFQSVHTVFTMAVLDDNILSFLECHTRSLQYYQKLKRLTNPAFPDLVAVSASVPEVQHIAHSEL